MERRRIVFGDYDTAQVGPWTLASWTFSVPDYQANLVTVPGRDGLLDLSGVLTNGEPSYNDRVLTARLECSEGTREDRVRLVDDIVNRLDGRRLDIILPDDPEHYVTGRVHVQPEYNDMAHAAVVVSATCGPWRYALEERTLSLELTNAEQLTVLPNSGRRAVVPQVVVSGASASAFLTVGEKQWRLGAGVHKLTGLLLRTGNTALTYSGYGKVAITYREAVL